MTEDNTAEAEIAYVFENHTIHVHLYLMFIKKSS